MKEKIGELLKEYGLYNKKISHLYNPNGSLNLLWFSYEVDVPSELIVQLKLMGVDVQQEELEEYKLNKSMEPEL